MKELIARLKDSVAFKVFMERVDEKAKDWEVVLRDSKDMAELYRAQGALRFFEFLKDLPDLMSLEADTEEKAGHDEY